MKQTSNRNDNARRFSSGSPASEEQTVELKPSVLGAPAVELLPPLVEGAPRLGARFIAAEEFDSTGHALPLSAGFEEEEEFDDDEEEFEEEDEFGDDEDDDFDDDEDEEDEDEDEELDEEEESLEDEEELEEEEEEFDDED